MCVKCQAIDAEIAHFEQLLLVTTDQPTIDAIAGLIANLSTEKAAQQPANDR